MTTLWINIPIIRSCAPILKMERETALKKISPRVLADPKIVQNSASAAPRHARMSAISR
jgi:hypothetical protein